MYALYICITHILIERNVLKLICHERKLRSPLINHCCKTKRRKRGGRDIIINNKITFVVTTFFNENTWSFCRNRGTNIHEEIQPFF